MRHIAAYALLTLGGKASPSAADVEALLKDAGVKADTEAIAAMISKFEGKQFHESVEAGLNKMKSMGSAAPVAAAAADSGPVVEEKKEEVEEVDMGGLFGGDEEDDY